MKKLGRDPIMRAADVQAHPQHQRPFCKLGVAAAVGITTIFAPMVFPSISRAQDQVEVAGQKVRTLKLEKTLAALDTATEKYRSKEMIAPSDTQVNYINTVQIPGVVTFLVGEHPDGDKTLTVAFPPQKDTVAFVPGEQEPGKRAYSLNDFSDAVKTLTGKELYRVKIILGQGTFEYHGKTTEYVNAFIFPVDENGNTTTKRGNGEYLVFACTYFINKTGAGSLVVVEPNNQSTLAYSAPK